MQYFWNSLSHKALSIIFVSLHACCILWFLICAFMGFLGESAHVSLHSYVFFFFFYFFFGSVSNICSSVLSHSGLFRSDNCNDGGGSSNSHCQHHHYCFPTGIHLLYMLYSNAKERQAVVLCECKHGGFDKSWERKKSNINIL